MAEARKYCTPDFVFKGVMTRPYYIIYLIAVVAAALAMLIFLFVIQRLFSRGGLPLSFGLMILFMILMMKALSKTVVVYFDEKSIFISDGYNNFERFLKKDIAGIYSYDYENDARSQISLTIILISGSEIHLTDTNLFKRPDQKKALMLKQFLKAALKHLNLKYAGKDHWRSSQGIGACRYVPMAQLS